MLRVFVCVMKGSGKRCTFSLARPLIYPRPAIHNLFGTRDGFMEGSLSMVHVEVQFRDDLSTLHLLCNLFLLLFYFRLSTLDSRYYYFRLSGWGSVNVLLQPHISLLISQQAFVLLLHFSRYFLWQVTLPVSLVCPIIYIF